MPVVRDQWGRWAGHYAPCDRAELEAKFKRAMASTTMQPPQPIVFDRDDFLYINDDGELMPVPADGPLPNENTRTIVVHEQILHDMFGCMVWTQQRHGPPLPDITG